MTSTHCSLAASLLAVFALAACDAPPPGEDAGAAEDGGVDASVCADFSGAYRTETLLDPCLANTPLQYGSFCVTQQGCAAATVHGTHGALEGVVEAGELRFESGFLRCTARREGAGLAIVCEDSDFMTTCSVTANAARSLAGACCTSDAACDAGDRCAPVTLEPSSPVAVASACVPTGPGALGSSCETTNGVDDCGSGLTCTSGGLGDDSVECRALCRGADCGSGQTCAWYPLTAPTVGFCTQACELYGDECGAGATCDGVTALAEDGALADGLACRITGTVAAREACARSTDCGADHQCARPPGGELRCHPICGPDHPCASEGDRCQLIGTTQTPTAGACVPR